MKRQFERVSNRTVRCLKCGKEIFKEFKNDHKYMTCPKKENTIKEEKNVV